MNLLRRLHEDEEGMETLQVVLIVGVAALVLAFYKSLWPGIKQWYRASVQEVIGWNE